MVSVRLWYTKKVCAEIWTNNWSLRLIKILTHSLLQHIYFLARYIYGNKIISNEFCRNNHATEDMLWWTEISSEYFIIYFDNIELK